MLDGLEPDNSITRRVGSRPVQEDEAPTVLIGRTYDAPLEDVWDACTNPERIPRWFLPVSGELREGGRYQVEGNAGGVIERCDPPRRFTATWEFAGKVSWIELRLSEAPGGGTRVELEHTARRDDMWTQFGPGALGVGWDLGLLGLSRHLATGESVPREAGAAFPASEAGQRFIEASSRGWCDAAIAAGADPGHARGAAERTLAFYTGSEVGAGE
jgi:uncharacterized protein YndB with AHSA1/START domain